MVGDQRGCARFVMRKVPPTCVHYQIEARERVVRRRVLALLVT